MYKAFCWFLVVFGLLQWIVLAIGSLAVNRSEFYEAYLIYAPTLLITPLGLLLLFINWRKANKKTATSR